MKLLVIAALLAVAHGACPNSCSGHGTCDFQDQCTCYKEVVDGSDGAWTGADCSQATCPRGVSWTTSDGTSHGHSDEVECSDAGICDRTNGECSCFSGYEGSACQRTSCPNDCSGHGQCRSNVDFAVDFSEAVKEEQGGDAVVSDAYYNYFRVSYDAAWDSGMQYGCLCDQGFRGADCSLVECPTDQDPMDSELCTKYAAWEGTSSADGSTGGNTIMASQWDAETGFNYYSPITEYPCNGAPSGDSCSGRGICDYGNGVCSCFDGFTGTACEEVSQLS